MLTRILPSISLIFSLSALAASSLQGQVLDDSQFVETKLISQAFKDEATIRFRDRHHGFSIQLPDTWELEEGFSDAYLDFVVVGVSPEEGPKDEFIENMNVLVEDVGNKVTLNDYLMWNLVGLMKELPRFHIHEKVVVEVNNMKMARVIYSWDLDQQRTVTYQYIFVRNNKGYVMTFSAEPKKFTEIQKTFDAIATSFQFDRKR